MKKILIVEDNENNMYLMNFILSKKYEIIKADTGEKGVELAIKEMPDLVIMDIQLPDIDGFEATKRIRESDANGDIPIVAITSYAMAGDKEKIINAGCNGYIEKPIDPETFVTQLEKFIK